MRMLEPAIVFFGGVAVTCIIFWIKGSAAGCPVMRRFTGDLFGTSDK